MSKRRFKSIGKLYCDYDKKGIAALIIKLDSYINKIEEKKKKSYLIKPTIESTGNMWIPCMKCWNNRKK